MNPSPFAQATTRRRFLQATGTAATASVLAGVKIPFVHAAEDNTQQLAIVEDYIHSLSPSEKQGIMGENAVQFYNL